MNQSKKLRVKNPSLKPFKEYKMTKKKNQITCPQTNKNKISCLQTKAKMERRTKTARIGKLRALQNAEFTKKLVKHKKGILLTIKNVLKDLLASRNRLIKSIN